MSGFFDLDDEPVFGPEDSDSGNGIPEVENPSLNLPVSEPTREITTATVYSKYGADDELIKNIFSVEGNKKVGVYFNQYLLEDDSPRQLDTNLDASLQQYVRIRQMEIFLADRLSFDRDAATGITTLEAEAQIYPGITPQPGDMFVTGIDDGRMGLFCVKDIRPLNYREKPAYSFTIKLFDLAKDHYLNNLDYKTIKSYYYSPQGAECGEPLVEEEVKLKYDSIDGYIYELVSFYYDQFFDRDTLTLLHPSNNAKVYDHATVEFFSRIVARQYLDGLPKATVYNVSSKSNKDHLETIWDVMLTGMRFWKHRICPTMIQRSAEEYVSPYTYNHVGSSHVDIVITPADRDSVISTAEEENADGYYVFGEAFYEQDYNNLTLVELQVLSALDGHMPTIERIVEMIELIYAQSKEEQFHRIPIIIWLLLKIQKQ